MSVEVTKYAFVSGEVSKSLLGRTDLEKYDLGVALGENFFVDYRGGLSNRAGTDLVDVVQSDWKETRFIPFKFAPAVNKTYVILFGFNYIRFIQNGAYVLEAGKVVTGITAAAPGIVTAVGHGFATGDLIKLYDIVGMTELNGQTFVVGATTANTFGLKKLDQAVSDFSTAALTAYVSGGTAYRVYTLVSPYADTDLALLKAEQIRSIIRLTHPSYKVRTLTRISDTNWTLALLSLGAALPSPATPTLTPSAAGTAGVAYCITAIDVNDNESLASAYGYNALSVNFASVAGSMRVTWTAVTGAVKYKIYRTQIIPVGADLSRAMTMGYVGVSFGPDFTDNNIIPNFTTTPPQHSDPFADGAITYIQVTGGGAGYTNASVVSASGGGTNFRAYLVVSGGVITAIVIVNAGENYTAPVISATVGAGATFVVTTSPTSNNAPRVSKRFQQRQIYAGSENKPLTIWGSKPGQLDNFDNSNVVSDSDGYSFDLESPEVAPIEHLVNFRFGLIVMSQAGLWQLTGGGDNVPVTPTNALALPQSTTGVSSVGPLLVDFDLLYPEAKGNTVRLLSYNDLTRVFTGQDMSILSNHLITPDNKIVRWDYASDPFKNIYSVRADGTMLQLVLVKEQNVYGWTTSVTQGQYKDVLVLQENASDSVYLMVKRTISGRVGKVIERVHTRVFQTVEDCQFLDGALALSIIYPAANLTFPNGAYNASVTVTADAAIFAVGDVGKIIRAAKGKLKVTAYISGTQVTALFQKTAPIIVHLSDVAGGLGSVAVQSGSWTMDAQYSVVGGLLQYEGMTARIFADGSVLPDQVIAGGKLTLPTPASRVVVSPYPYKSTVKTLPPTMQNLFEGKLKRPVAARLRMIDSRGIKYGPDLMHLRELKERTTEPYAEPTVLQDGVKKLNIASAYNPEGQFFLVQDQPLPLTILGFTDTFEVEDAIDNH